MANIKSAKKRILIGRANEARNRANRTYLRTTLKRFDAAVTEGNREQADVAYKVAVQTVDKAVGKGLLHKNNAARKKSGMTRRLSNMA